MNRPSEKLIERPCTNPNCDKPVLVSKKELNARWGRDRYHQECYRKIGRFNKKADKMFDI